MKITDKNVFLDEEACFSQDKLYSTPRDCVPVYTWSWASAVSKEKTDETLEEMKRLGIKGTYILPIPSDFRPCRVPTTFCIDYLGKEYMEHYVYAYNKARELGMHLWLYDEGGWPSGSACNRVLLDHPEYAKRLLASRKTIFKAGETYSSSDDAAAFLPDGKMIDKGYEFAEDTTVTEYYSKIDLFDYPASSDYPDLSLREATDYFLKVTHEEYKKHIGGEFGENIPIVFTDEAVLPYPTPYRPEMEKEFERRHGYSIRPCLPILNLERLPETEWEREAVINWYDYCSELFCNNFLAPYKKWVNENGMAFSGHFNVDHIPNCSVRGRTFNAMRALRYLDIPGIDAIWRQIFPGEKVKVGGNMTSENRFFPRYASSAASQVGSTRAMTECMAIYGQGVTFDEMRFVLNFQAIRGINLFNMMSATYGETRGFQMAGAMPKFRERFACYSDLAHFNSYIERLTYITSVGKSVIDTALYLPIRDFYLVADESEGILEFDRVGFGMEEKQISFDIFDDDVILSCDREALKKGEIRMGIACYKTLVISDCKYMKPEVKKLLEEFILGGGRVIATCDYINDEISGAVYSATPWDYITSPIVFEGDTKGIRLMQRDSDNSRIFYICNEAYTSASVSAKIEEGGYLLNLTDGKLTSVKGDTLTLKLNMGEMVALIYTDAEIKCDGAPKYTEEMLLDGEYTLRRTKQFVIDINNFYSKDITEEAVSVSLGDWREYVGDSFSGSCVYTTEFSVPAKKDMMLDLGEACYSCEVFVNKVSVGVKVMSPYRFEIPEELLKDNNLLEIRVSNTAANEFVYTDSFDKWGEAMLSPYHNYTKEFNKSTLKSGLFGPVKLYY